MEAGFEALIVSGWPKYFGAAQMGMGLGPQFVAGGLSSRGRMSAARPASTTQQS